MTTISVDTLRAWLEKQQPVTILDVRPRQDYAEWFIVRLNEAGVLPDSDLTALEAGANRCAIS